MGLMVALVTDFDSRAEPKLALDDDIPLMHQRSLKIRLHAAHRNARVQSKRTKWISTRKAARHVIASEALRLAYAHIVAVALITRQVDGFIERHAFSAIGATALVFFTA